MATSRFATDKTRRDLSRKPLAALPGPSEPVASLATGGTDKTSSPVPTKPRKPSGATMATVCTKLATEDLAKLDRIRKATEGPTPSRSHTLRWLVQRYQEQ